MINKKTFYCLVIFIFIASGLAGFLVSFYHYKNLNHVTDTAKMRTYHYPALFVKQIANDKNAGEKIFKHFCIACHGNPPMIDMNAPRIGDKKAWGNYQRMGITTLMQMTITGTGAMPARGGCFECSDTELREAVKYILEKNK